MIITTISSQNQITLPRAILDQLKLSAHDRVLIEARDQEILVKPLGKSVVDQIAGSLTIPRGKRGVSFRQALAKTKKIVSRKLAQ